MGIDVRDGDPNGGIARGILQLDRRDAFGPGSGSVDPPQAGRESRIYNRAREKCARAAR
jgi:hypothetical protein